MENLYVFDEMYKQIKGIDIYGGEVGGVRIKGGINATPLTDIMDLTGKVAIVTGGARGLGFCIVNRLCQAGANVVIADIAIEFAEDAVAFFKSKGYDVKFKKTDVRYVDQIKTCVDFTVKEYGKIDILVNDAAIWAFRPFLELTEEMWDDALDTNLKGTVFFIQAVAKSMVEKGVKGKIVNIASVAGISYETSFGWLTQYAAAKSGVVGISKSLNRELKPLGINVNCVLPGSMMTPGGMHTEMTPELTHMFETNPGAPIYDPDDVAKIAVVLCTDVANAIYGATIVADGGCSLIIQK